MTFTQQRIQYSEFILTPTVCYRFQWSNMYKFFLNSIQVLSLHNRFDVSYMFNILFILTITCHIFQQLNYWYITLSIPYVCFSIEIRCFIKLHLVSCMIHLYMHSINIEIFCQKALQTLTHSQLKWILVRKSWNQNSFDLFIDAKEK